MFSLFQESVGDGGFHIPRSNMRGTVDHRSGENVSNTGPIDRTEVKRIQQDIVLSRLDRPVPANSDSKYSLSLPTCGVDTMKKQADTEWCQIVKKLKPTDDEKESVSVGQASGSFRENCPDRSEERRKVRFAGTTNISKPTQLSMIMDDIDPDTLNKRSSNDVARRAGLRKFRLKSVRQRELWFKELYWSRKDVEGMKLRASKKAKSFRFSNKVAVNQIERLFDDFCRKNSEENGNFQEIDEEAEEILNYFLHDWAASEGRGLEEMTAATNVFEEGRSMAVESILAYQQMLRNMEYSEEEIAMLLRARSESASRRARMFALYLALGDALVSSMDTESRRFVWISQTKEYYSK